MGVFRSQSARPLLLYIFIVHFLYLPCQKSVWLLCIHNHEKLSDYCSLSIPSLKSVFSASLFRKKSWLSRLFCSQSFLSMSVSFTGRLPILYGHSGHLSIGQSRTSFFSPQQQSMHFALIAFIGVMLPMHSPPF